MVHIELCGMFPVGSGAERVQKYTGKMRPAGATISNTASGQLLTEDGPFASDTVTNTYANRLRTALALQQPTGAWTNGFKDDAAARLTNLISQAGSFTNEYLTGVTGQSGFSSSLIKRLLLPNTSIITN